MSLWVYLMLHPGVPGICKLISQLCPLMVSIHTPTLTSRGLASTLAFLPARSTAKRQIVAQAATTVQMFASQAAIVPPRSLSVRMLTATVRVFCNLCLLYAARPNVKQSFRWPNLYLHHPFWWWLRGYLLSDRAFLQHLEGLQAAARPAFWDRQRIGVVTWGRAQCVEESQRENSSGVEVFTNHEIGVALWRRFERITLVQSSATLQFSRPSAGTLAWLIPFVADTLYKIFSELLYLSSAMACRCARSMVAQFHVKLQSGSHRSIVSRLCT